MDEIVAIIIGVFIANYKTEEHPYLSSFVKAFIIALIAFLFVITKDILNGELTFLKFKFGLILSFSFWFLLSIFLIIVEFIFKSRK